MSAYEFADEVGLKLLDAYPVTRDRQKVYVKPSELTSREITNIQLEFSKVYCAMLDLVGKANRRVLTELESKMAPEDWEAELTNPAIQRKVRGRWKTWAELTPQEQAELREKQGQRIARLTADPEPEGPEQDSKARLRSARREL